jgi:hypothetical protein
MTTPVAEAPTTRILWIAPGMDLPASLAEFAERPTSVIPTAFPARRRHATTCAVCGFRLAIHRWQVTDGSHGPVTDCSEVLP